MLHYSTSISLLLSFLRSPCHGFCGFQQFVSLFSVCFALLRAGFLHRFILVRSLCVSPTTPASVAPVLLILAAAAFINILRRPLRVILQYISAASFAPAPLLPTDYSLSGLRQVAIAHTPQPHRTPPPPSAPPAPHARPPARQRLLFPLQVWFSPPLTALFIMQAGRLLGFIGVSPHYVIAGRIIIGPGGRWALT